MQGRWLRQKGIRVSPVVGKCYAGVANFSGGDGGNWVDQGPLASFPPEQGCPMSTKVLIEVDPKHEAIVRRALALAEEMEQLALTAPEGAVFDVCEGAIIERGRTLQG